MQISEALAMRERIDRRILELDRTRPFRWYAASNSYHCPGPLYHHEPTSDNPMRTGRCNVCRAFIGYSAKGWRSLSRTTAMRLGLYGARR